MGPKVLFIHASNQMRTVWLMSSSRFSSPYEIQTRNPSLTLSLIALLVGNLVMSLYDYFNYPTDVFAGYVAEGVSRTTYVSTYFVSYLAGTALSYVIFFIIAAPLGYTKRFWHGLIGLNWWAAMVVPIFFPLLLILLMIDDNDVFYSPMIALLIFAIIFFIWKSINLAKHAFKINIGKAVLLTVLGGILSMAIIYFITNAVGISVL